MGRTAKGGLSKHATKGYRISIGRKAGGGYRTFWLGHVRSLAEYAAEMFREHFTLMQAEKRDTWAAKDEETVWSLVEWYEAGMVKMRQQHLLHVKAVEHKGRVLDQMFGDAPIEVKGESQTVAAPPGKNLYDAVAAYLTTLNGKRLSDSHKWRAKQIVDTDLKRIRPDCPLAVIDYLWLDKLCDHFKARPVTKKSGKPMKAETVVTTLRYLRTFFNWVDETGFGDWIGPRKLLRPFRVRKSELMTSTELRESKNIKQFDIPTLVKLYHAATDPQKVWMLTALFTAGTQTELSVLEKAEFDLGAGMLGHHRNKTGVEGQFWLPPELVLRLRAEFKKHKAKPLAFYTKDGCPLVTFMDNKKVSDAVRLSWDRLRIRAKLLDALSFKFLRKFVADYATRVGDETMGQIGLSQVRQTVLAKSYTSHRAFARFNEIQRQMYAEFVAAGMFKQDQKKATKQKAAA